MGSPSRWLGLLAAAGLALSAQAAAAQEAAEAPTPARAWTLAGSAGVASVSDATGVALGGSFSWHFVPRWAVEIGGEWLDRPGSQQTWAVEASTHFRLLTEARHVPYLRAGVAAYTTAFDGTAIDDVPEFYRRRVDAQSQSLFVLRHTFTDPAVILGGGLDLQITNRLRVRPAVEVLTALRNGDSLVTPIAHVQVAYHFESGRVTPARRR